MQVSGLPIPVTPVTAFANFNLTPPNSATPVIRSVYHAIAGEVGDTIA